MGIDNYECGCEWDYDDNEWVKLCTVHKNIKDIRVILNSVKADLKTISHLLDQI